MSFVNHFCWFVAISMVSATAFAQPSNMTTSHLHANLALSTQALLADTASIEQDRKVELEALGAWIAHELTQGNQAHLIFICTHNSRRSHMSQLWAQVAASMVGLNGVRTHSGGTEATACNPRTVSALQRAGFHVNVVDSLHGASNPTYEVSFGPEAPAVRCFSKIYGDEVNPKQGFAAVMTCSSADQGCPVVYGAKARFSIPYVDPKVSDGTELESATYDARLRQIGAEMMVVMAHASEVLKTKK